MKHQKERPTIRLAVGQSVHVLTTTVERNRPYRMSKGFKSLLVTNIDWRKGEVELRTAAFQEEFSVYKFHELFNWCGLPLFSKKELEFLC